METNQRIVEKVQKLLNLAADAGATEAEAANAAATAQRLILKHHLDEAKLKGNLVGDVDSEPIERASFEPDRKPGPMPEWWAFLADALGRPFMCKVYRIRGHGIFMVGRKTDREALRYVWMYLRREIERLSREGWRRVEADRGGMHPAPWKRSFCVGAVESIRQRLTEDQRALAASDRPETPGGATMALVLASRYDSAEKFLSESLNVKLRASTSRSHYDRSGSAAGRAAGRVIPINTNGSGGPGLGGGVKRLGGR